MIFETVKDLNDYLLTLKELKENDFIGIVGKNLSLIDGFSISKVRENFKELKFDLFGYSFKDFIDNFGDLLV